MKKKENKSVTDTYKTTISFEISGNLINIIVSRQDTDRIAEISLPSKMLEDEYGEERIAHAISRACLLKWSRQIKRKEILFSISTMNDIAEKSVRDIKKSNSYIVSRVFNQ